jgi:hypothetical protein
VTRDDYLGRVRATVHRAADYLPPGRLQEVHRLIDNGEPAEGLCSLAWAIVNEQLCVPASIVEAIVEYTRELIDDEFMPRDLSNYGQG